MFLSALLVGCQEYVLGGKKPEPEPTAPLLTLVDTALDVGGVCGDERMEVRLQNDGDADLVLTALAVTGDGWVLGAFPVPEEVAPGEAVAIPLQAGVGTAVLEIRSNDSVAPVVEVPLRGEADEGPSAFVTAPGEDEVVDPDVDLTLEAVTSDPESPPTSLTAAWSSSLTGDVGTATPDADGFIRTVWPASARANGPQVIAVRVTDPCGNTAEHSLYYCQDGPWSVASLEENAWHTEGAAIVDQAEGTVTLGSTVSSAFDAYALYDADHFAAQFELRGDGAGLGFVVMDADRAPTDWIGADGCGLGLGDCVGGGLPGWALVFDTTSGDGNDCGATPSVGVTVDGALPATELCATSPALDDGDWHDVRVTVDGTLTLSIDGVVVLDAVSIPTTTVPSWLGLTGAGDWAVRNLSYTDYRCD